VHRYARRCLTDLIDTSPYRGQDPSYLDAVADAIAESAGDSFLVALITARSHALRKRCQDNPYDPLWRASLPREAAEAMRQDLDQRLADHADKARDLLLPLAYAQGTGLPWESIWPTLARAPTGKPYTNADLDWLITQAGYYITESTLGVHSVYRLYHESLAEHLRQHRDTETDHATIVDALTNQVPRLADGTTDWANTHPYTKASIATHAAGTDRLDHLLTQPRFLLHIAPAALLAALPRTRTPQGQATGDAYRHAATRIRASQPDQHAAHLQLAARCGRAPHLADAITDSGLPLPWSTDWASSWRLQHPHHTITGHTGQVTSVAFGRLNGRPVIATGSDDRTVRLWDAATGNPIGDPLRHDDGWRRWRRNRRTATHHRLRRRRRRHTPVGRRQRQPHRKPSHWPQGPGQLGGARAARRTATDRPARARTGQSSTSSTTVNPYGWRTSR
jgi:hypothetical protein